MASRRQWVGQLFFVAYAALYHKRLILLQSPTEETDVWQLYVGHSGAQTSSSGNTLKIAACVIQNDEASDNTIVRLPVVAGLNTNHWTPVVSRTPRPSGHVHAPCGGSTRGPSVGWPCIAPLQEELAPLGLAP